MNHAVSVQTPPRNQRPGSATIFDLPAIAHDIAGEAAKESFAMNRRHYMGACLVAVHLIGCTSDGKNATATEQPDASRQDECGRVEAAARFSVTPFAAMETMAEQCENGEGVLFSCNPMSYGLAALTGVFFAPMGFAIGLGSEDVERHHCGSSR